MKYRLLLFLLLLTTPAIALPPANDVCAPDARALRYALVAIGGVSATSEEILVVCENSEASSAIQGRYAWGATRGCYTYDDRRIIFIPRTREANSSWGGVAAIDEDGLLHVGETTSEVVFAPIINQGIKHAALAPAKDPWWKKFCFFPFCSP